MNNRFERLPDQAKIAGVCAGLAAYFGLSVLLVRVIFLIGIPLTSVPALLIYAILWVVLPVGQTTVVSPYLASQPVISASFMSSYNSGKSGGLVGGIVLIALGVLFLLDRWLHIDLGDLWPFVLIAVGVWLLFRDRIVKPGSAFNNNPGTNPNPGTGTGTGTDPDADRRSSDLPKAY
jgi:phage shock protein C